MPAPRFGATAVGGRELADPQLVREIARLAAAVVGCHEQIVADRDVAVRGRDRAAPGRDHRDRRLPARGHASGQGHRHDLGTGSGLFMGGGHGTADPCAALVATEIVAGAGHAQSRSRSAIDPRALRTRSMATDRLPRQTRPGTRAVRRRDGPSDRPSRRSLLAARCSTARPHRRRCAQARLARAERSMAGTSHPDQNVRVAMTDCRVGTGLVMLSIVIVRWAFLCRSLGHRDRSGLTSTASERRFVPPALHKSARRLGTVPRCTTASPPPSVSRRQDEGLSRSAPRWRRGPGGRARRPPGSARCPIARWHPTGRLRPLPRRGSRRSDR